MTIRLGGFGLCAIPENLVAAAIQNGVKGLHTISNNMGVDGSGMGQMLEAGMIASHLGSYVDENRLLEKLVIAGDLHLTLIPQGSLAERIRAGLVPLSTDSLTKPSSRLPNGLSRRSSDDLRRRLRFSSFESWRLAPLKAIDSGTARPSTNRLRLRSFFPGRLGSGLRSQWPAALCPWLRRRTAIARQCRACLS
jgi:hypothetical protein